MRIVFESDDLSVRSADPEEGGEVSGREVLGEAVAGLLGELWTRGPRAVYKSINPVDHKIVCRCICWTPAAHGDKIGSWEQFEERDNCGTLNGIGCGEGGELGDCAKHSVEVSRGVPGDEPLLVKSES